jgi:predicted Ser/Thr protein kinase
MRKAGDLITAYLREGKLAANRSEPIGTGGNAVVYASDVPGNVMKQGHVADESFPGRSLTDEANLQAIAAEMGIAPRVAGLEKFPGGIGNRIEMSDVRTNFEPHGNDTQFPSGRDAVRVNQQLGALALKGVRLEDRHGGNVLYNKATGRPMQLDFGIAGRVEGSDQVATLANATAEGFEAAGLGDVASIYRDTVMDLLEGGDVADAMDVAKQGFSRLQKIK